MNGSVQGPLREVSGQAGLLGLAALACEQGLDIYSFERECRFFDEGDVRRYVEPLLGEASPQPPCEWVCARAAEGGFKAGSPFGAGSFGLGAGAGFLQF